MLEYFEDIVFPAFKGDYIRGKRNELPRFFLENVQIKEIDDEYVMVGNYVRDDMRTVGSKTTNIVFNSPASKNGIKKVIEETGGLAEVSLLVTDAEGEKRRIKEDAFTSTTKIEYNGNISPSGDEYIASQAKKDGVISNTSPENARIYERVKGIIKRLIP